MTKTSGTANLLNILPGDLCEQSKLPLCGLSLNFVENVFERRLV